MSGLSRHAAYGVLLVAVLAASLLAGAALRARDDVATVSASFDTVGGSISAGADVKLRGYVVGSVASVEAHAGGGVELTMDIQGGDLDQVPSGVVARVLPATVFGTTYVELVPVGRGAGSLADGAVVPQDRRAPTIELQRALDGIDQLVDALGPAELSTVLHSLASAVDGQGRAIGETLDGLGRVARTLGPQVPLVRDDLRLLADNLRTLREVAPELLDAVDDTVVVTDHLVERRVDLSRLVDEALALVDDSGRLLDGTSERLERTLEGAAVLIDALYDNRDDLARVPGALDDLLRRVVTVTDGGKVRIDATVVNAGRYPYYTPADCPRYGSVAGRNCP